MDVVFSGDLYIRKEPCYRKTFNISLDQKIDFKDFAYLMDFGQISYIYQVFIREDGPVVRYRFYDGSMSPFFKISDEELKSEYTRLIDFLEESKYVGMQAKINVDSSHPDDIVNRIILYKENNIIIAFNPEDPDYLFNKKIPLQVFDTNYVNKIEYVGNQMDLYSDKQSFFSELYHEILLETKNEAAKKTDEEKGKSM